MDGGVRYGSGLVEGDGEGECEGECEVEGEGLVCSVGLDDDFDMVRIEDGS